ncbi:MAG: PilZ domain-containing protein [Pseudolabrys sp.]|nr:PilZ domain-containing protein [Pseudolabrys sp.]MBV9954393.1 PilZ domain-containing protein [Pseudolabrys sp.]
MLNDKRKAPRRAMRYTAWIALEKDQLRGCALSDISDTGCRLDVEDGNALPEQFMLLLSRRGFPKRHCRIVWRAADQVGVAFDRRMPSAEIAKNGPKAAELAPAPDAPSVAPAETVNVDAPADTAKEPA